LRIKISAETNHPAFFPYSYQHALQAALYSLIRESSLTHAAFLHEKGYVKDGIDKLFKFFTFSKLDFTPKTLGKGGFQNVRQVSFTFSTIMEDSLKHLVLGVFSNKQIKLSLGTRAVILNIVSVDVLADPQFSNKETFVCLSPIAASTKIENETGRTVPHFLDYAAPAEREHFILNLKNNLIRKFETLHNTEYAAPDSAFNFQFDPSYIQKKKGRISKLIDFKNGIKVKAMEAPFTVEADPELIKIGYDCGWGEKNSAGFGCVKSVRA